MGEDAVPRRRWVVWALGVYAAVVVVVLLLPVGYSAIVNRLTDWVQGATGVTTFGSGWIEFSANVLMFVPLGFLLTLLFRHPWYGTLLAVALSAGAEIAQIVIPARQATLRDVLANSLGAAIGALIAWVVVLASRRRHAAVSRG
ncbi:VanZ family protein [Microbacterium sp. CJ88]|uniref:VanZ family protein n=1 Tax=Microbacterium sp. CJ88 TaxID=3445672 RepID=UPI003F658729